MGKKLLIGIMAVFMAASALGLAFAEDVFVTKSGKYYHHAASPFIKNRETTKMSKEEAEAKGYKPSRSYLKAQASGDVAEAEDQAKK